jgi:DNA-binding response OmpR family regulator
MAGKVLVVDDDASVQRLLQYTLKQEGYEVVLAADGTEALRLWTHESPTLILLDVTLPTLDGYEVATRVRADEGPGQHVPIIMLTADKDVQQKVRALRAGADDYLIKPFHPAELLARMKSLIARFSPTDTLVGRPPMGRIHAYYGAKGGVGTTTIAINAAIALQALGRRVCLVDGNLQFGDHRVFLDLGLDRKSIVDIVSARWTPSSSARSSSRTTRAWTRSRPVAGVRGPRVRGAHAPDPRAPGRDVRLRGRRHRQAPRRREPHGARRRRDDLCGDDRGPVVPQERAPRARDDRPPGLRVEQAQAGAQPLERVHGHQRQERRGCPQARDRPPDRERVPGRDLGPQHRCPVHSQQSRLGARAVMLDFARAVDKTSPASRAWRQSPDSWPAPFVPEGPA